MTAPKRFFILAGNYQIAKTLCLNSKSSLILNKNAFYVRDLETFLRLDYNPLKDVVLYEHNFYKNPYYGDIEEELRIKNGTT
jgi:hypothetical protein